jgi:hypothetical protein
MIVVSLTKRSCEFGRIVYLQVGHEFTDHISPRRYTDYAGGSYGGFIFPQPVGDEIPVKNPSFRHDVQGRYPTTIFRVP